MTASPSTTQISYDGYGNEDLVETYDVSFGQAPLDIAPESLPSGSYVIRLNIANFVPEGSGGYIKDPTDGSVVANLSLQYGQGTASLIATSPSTDAVSTVAVSTVATVHDVATTLINGQWEPVTSNSLTVDSLMNSGMDIDTGPKILTDQSGGTVASPTLALSGNVVSYLPGEYFNFAAGEVVNIADNGVQVGSSTIQSVNEPGTQRYLGPNDTSWGATIGLTPGNNAITITTTDPNGLSASASLDYTYTPPSSGGTGAGSGGSAAGGGGAAAPAPTDTVSIAPNVTFLGRGAFELSGTVASTAGVGQVEMSALVDGVETDLGAATVNPDGTFTFKDVVGANVQSYITATLTDDARQTATADAGFNLQAGIGGEPYVARQTRFDPATGDADVTSLFNVNGARTVVIHQPDQTVDSGYADTFLNGGMPDTTFVFTPGHGSDAITLFRAAGPSHDTLSLPSTDFASIADILRDTQQTAAGAIIHDPTSGDTIQLTGVSKAALIHNQRDFTLHA